MTQLTNAQQQALQRLLAALIDQEAARVLVEPQRAASGFWFGGGNLAQDAAGTIWLSGRYRNYGDSRTGLQAGERGLACTILRSDDGGRSFQQVSQWSKADLSAYGAKVLSYEGTALHQRADGSWELFISAEKEIAYPDPFVEYQKPGTGVWVIDRLTGPSPDQFDPASLEPVFQNQSHLEYLHVKDPVVFDRPDGSTALIFCSHPHVWSSSNTGLAIRPANENAFASGFTLHSWEVVSRGAAWDVAATRVTAQLAVPKVGLFADAPDCAIYFYDGAECLRSHEENARAHSRPRGYSCEELGGALFGWAADFPRMERLSRLAPLFISPWGTGCSRYVDCLQTDTGILAVWEQSQPDQSQPLVGHFLPLEQVAAILAGG